MNRNHYFLALNQNSIISDALRSLNDPSRLEMVGHYNGVRTRDLIVKAVYAVGFLPEMAEPDKAANLFDSWSFKPDSEPRPKWLPLNFMEREPGSKADLFMLAIQSISIVRMAYLGRYSVDVKSDLHLWSRIAGFNHIYDAYEPSNTIPDKLSLKEAIHEYSDHMIFDLPHKHSWYMR